MRKPEVWGQARSNTMYSKIEAGIIVSIHCRIFVGFGCCDRVAPRLVCSFIYLSPFYLAYFLIGSFYICVCKSHLMILIFSLGSARLDVFLLGFFGVNCGSLVISEFRFRFLRFLSIHHQHLLLCSSVSSGNQSTIELLLLLLLVYLGDFSLLVSLTLKR